MRNGRPQKQKATMEPLDDAIDHVRGSTAGCLIVEYDDYEMPLNSRQAFREIERVEKRRGEGIGFAFRHFPLTEIHPNAYAAAAIQDQFWSMHELLFHHQTALEDDDLRRYAVEFELDVVRFDRDRTGARVVRRVRRDLESGIASGEVRGTPTLFTDSVVHRGSYDAAALLEALAA